MYESGKDRGAIDPTDGPFDEEVVVHGLVAFGRWIVSSEVLF